MNVCCRLNFELVSELVDFIEKHESEVDLVAWSCFQVHLEVVKDAFIELRLHWWWQVEEEWLG